jgi:hypothetical protein
MSALPRPLALAALVLLGACASPIVGGECKPGFVLCGGHCVDPRQDSQHCGTCGHSCGGFECKAAKCSSAPLPDAGPDGGASKDASARLDGGKGKDAGDASFGPPGTGKGGAGTPFLPDGGLKFPDIKVAQGCGIGLTTCGDACADLRSDPVHCGDCGTGCKADQFCSLGTCVDTCMPPLMDCGGGCFDFQTDEANCGSCGNVCASGICNAGECADAVPGSLVVVGHDYGASNQGMQRIGGNAVLLLARAPVRVLVYRGSAKTTSINGVKKAIDFVATDNTSQWQETNADADMLSAQLRDASAFVIEAQAGSTDDELLALGQKWGLALTQFLARGGVIALFETSTKSNHGTYQVLQPAGLFSTTGREAISRQRLDVVAPGDSVAAKAITHYTGEPITVHFLDVPSDGTVVVQDSDGKPVVFHRVIAP